MRIRLESRLSSALFLTLATGCGDHADAGGTEATPATPAEPAGSAAQATPAVPADVLARLRDLSPAELPPPPADPTNRWADDPGAVELGKQFFFDPRFSGPLLDSSNDGIPGTLGNVGDTGKVACAGCHVPASGFLDMRSPRHQISLGAGWTRRRAPSLLDVAQVRLLGWDGRHDTAFSQPFTPIEDAFEFNSSRLFVAQQIRRLYKSGYEALFGPLPAALDTYGDIAPSDAGCTVLPQDVIHQGCDKPGHDDDEVTQVVANMGKAIEAYTRTLQCGRSRFDRWVAGDATAMTPDEQAGALLFVGKGGCSACHGGPFFTVQEFHNMGLIPDYALFISAIPDPGASEGLAAMLNDPLGSTGKFSDGQDDRRASVPPDPSTLLGTFRTPGLRCVGRRPSFLHTGQFRSLEDVVHFFNRGGDPVVDPPIGYLGQSENHPRYLTDSEEAQLVAFLRALDGDGPAPGVADPPTLPPDP
jgi:cytochrome c peroxidase